MTAHAGPGRRRYVSASELADYAFCPRSHYYRQHAEGRTPAAGAVARERAGTSYHLRTIGADRRWAAASPFPWVAAVLAGGAILVLLLWLALGSLP
ncbi:MAG: PD-(D/E)XK nuclease family protein [Thermoplasmata archaeon]|nr:PD-(D/E)XK nuclease family protein [Thermoplasmata archaeon]MCI4361638.1 PD-(D/E)XK nuclease family protein [Thermoplasmata archaeon]MCI4370199.1 PD-(D/E)XK nuclease family protein [Thermoplasmata archaeon]